MNKEKINEKIVNYVFILWLDYDSNEFLIFDTFESANNYMKRHCVFSHQIEKVEVINYCSKDS